MRRLKNIEGKNEQQLEAIRDEEKKQLDLIKNQREKKLDAIERQKEGDEIVYLKDKIDKLFEMYPKFFTNQNKTSLTSIAKNESSINYKNSSHEFLLSNGRPHKLNFFEKVCPPV